MKEQVIKFEKILDESRAIIDELQVILDKLEKNQNNYQELKVYYGSEEYFKDVELSDTYNVKCGVLSQDSVYNLILDTYESNIRMLELATKMLKEH